MVNKKNNPVVISGPSGSGKSELIDCIEKEYPLFIEATGMTTRERRENEVGKMNFVSREEFEDYIKGDELIEYCIYNNNYYGVPKSEFDKLYDYYVIFNVGYPSAKVIQGIYQNTFMIYLLPPNEEELLRRFGDRDNNRFLLGIEETMNYAFNYDYLLISDRDEVEKAASDFLDIVTQSGDYQQKKLILSKNRDFVSNFYKRGMTYDLRTGYKR